MLGAIVQPTLPKVRDLGSEISRRREVPTASCAESEPEFVRGALGTHGEGRVPFEADSVRGRFVTTCAARIRRLLSRGTQPPRQGQRSVIPVWRGADDEARAIDPLSRTPRRSSQVLPPKGRMNFWTIRVVAPAASDGYWLEINPLGPGVHTVNFGGTSGAFTADVTYTITVN
jgi:hypothetical protein